MTVTGVMVSYNYSGPEENANIITVSSSGIKFSKRWVLTHGSILSPLKIAQEIQKAKGKTINSEEFYQTLPEIYITSEKTKVTESLDPYKNIQELSSKRNKDGMTQAKIDKSMEHDSYRVRVETGRICHIWQCPVLDRCVEEILCSWTIGHRDGDLNNQKEIGKTLFSVFVLIDLDADINDSRPLRPLSELLDRTAAMVPDRGDRLHLHTTPFGCEVFLNSVSVGAVCGAVSGRLLLTDAAAALGAEGGAVFDDSGTLVGAVACSVAWWRGEWVGLTLVAPLRPMLQTKLRVATPALPAPLSPSPTQLLLQNALSNGTLVGAVACSVAWWRGEWVGLTLVAPLRPMLQTKLRVATPALPAPLSPSPTQLLLQNALSILDRTVVLVRCGDTWGSGVYLGQGYFVTCAHVVRNHVSEKLSVYCGGVSETVLAKFVCPAERAYDLALLYGNAHTWQHLAPAVRARRRPVPGEKVIAVGYPFFNERQVRDLRPSVTRGRVSSASPSLLHTTCCVQSGCSGGAVCSLEAPACSPELLAVLVCHAKTHATDACYPHVNMAVPVQAFQPILDEYIITKDLNILKHLDNNQETIQSQWKLHPYRSKV